MVLSVDVAVRWIEWRITTIGSFDLNGIRTHFHD
jgi:hypothetical protein